MLSETFSWIIRFCTNLWICSLCDAVIKGIIHPKIKITSWFTHPKTILGVWLSFFRWIQFKSYIKKCPGSQSFKYGFVLHKHIDLLLKAFINPLEPRGALFMMDRWTLLDFKISTVIHCHYKAWKSQDIFLYSSNCICLKKESHILLGWHEG